MRQLLVLVIAVGNIVQAGSAFAQSDGDRDRARTHFERGLQQVESERWEDALASFDESLRIYPTQTVLFNRALCLGLLGRPAEAVRALEDHQRRYGSTVDAQRRAEVASELARLRTRVGRIAIRVDGATAAAVLLDGREVGDAPLPRALVVNPGRHQVTVRATGIAPVSRWVDVGTGDEVSVVMALDTSGARGTIQVNVDIEGAQVILDGAIIGTTPLSDPLSALVGHHTIAVQREGHGQAQAEVDVVEGETAVVNLNLGAGAGGAQPAAGGSRGLRIGAYVSAGVAVAALAAGLGLFLWNNGQYADWDDEDAALRSELAAAEASDRADIDARIEDNNSLHETIGTVDIVSWVLVGTGAAAAAASVVLFVLGYRNRSQSTAPQVALLPAPDGLVLAGRW